MSAMSGTTMLLNLVADGSLEVDAATKDEIVSKARHMLRDDEGKSRRMNDHEDNIPDDSGPLPMRHSGAVLPQFVESEPAPLSSP